MDEEKFVEQYYTQKKLWAEFYEWKTYVNTKNRFDNKHYFLDILDENKELYQRKIDKDQIFYRGRIFNLDDVLKIEDNQLLFDDNNDKAFEGYAKEKSGAPSAEQATEGRLNCNGVPYLYTCEDVKTVVYELRPIKAEAISVAEMQVNRPLVLADCTKSASKKLKDANFILSRVLSNISNEFSRPHYQGHKYWFTQYLAGQFMNMGFDGIIFESSILSDTKNYVFFNPSDCTAISSKLYKVNKIQISFDLTTREDLLLG